MFVMRERFELICVSDRPAAQLCEQMGKIRRQRRGEFHIFLSGGMKEAEHHRVQCLSFQAEGALLRTIDIISEHRMSDV